MHKFLSAQFFRARVEPFFLKTKGSFCSAEMGSRQRRRGKKERDGKAPFEYEERERKD